MSNRLQRYKDGPISFLRGGEGEPFVLLHGIPGSALSWEAVGERISERFEVIVPDMLGFGASDLPSDGYYIEAQAKAFADFLTRQNIRELYLGGHDIGGPVAITLMREYPQLTIKGLLIAPTNLLKSVKIPLFFKIARIPFITGLINRVMIGNPIAHRLLYDKAVKHKESFSWESYKQHLTPSGKKYTRLMFQRTMVEFEVIYQPIEEYLPSITAPTLITWGRNDPVLQRSLGRRTNTIIEGSTLEMYEDTGHFLPEERPDLLAEDIIGFFCNPSQPDA